MKKKKNIEGNPFQVLTSTFSLMPSRSICFASLCFCGVMIMVMYDVQLKRR